MWKLNNKINTMKLKLFALLAMMFVGFTSCYDHTEIIDRLNDHEQRIRTLETLCAQMNTSISSLQTIVDALKQNDYVVSVAPIKYGDQEVGYSIIFTSGKTITIYHGKDGKDGADGANGTNGVNGSTPQIGVKKFTDGVYYWTLNGEWILDDAGEKIRVTGRDGQDGANGNDGADGKDAVTPKLKIEDDYWFVSYDNGANWIQLQKAVGEDGTDGKDGADGDSMFQKVDQTKDAVILTLADGTVITLPKVTEFDVIFDTDHILASEEETIIIPFTVVGATEKVTVECLSNFEAVQGTGRMISETKGEISVVVEWFYKDTPYKLLAFFSHGNKQVIVKAFSFEEKVLKSIQTAYEATVAGGIVEVKVSTNMDYEVIIPESAKSWISVVETKAVRTDVLQLKIEPNTEDNERFAEINVNSIDGTMSSEFSVFQSANIKFKDSIIKNLCVSAFDKDGDGELSLAEAAAVTDLNAMVLTDKRFVSFDEFKYFTRVTQIPSDYFSGCENLKSISLPESLVSIHVSAFSDCKSLEVVNMSEGLESISSYAFSSTRITSLYIPSTVEWIDASAFYRCTELSYIVVDEKNERYDSRDNCNAIIQTGDNRLILGARYTIIPSSVKVIGYSSFEYRHFDSSILEIPEGVEEICSSAFYSCSNIGKVKISSTVKDIAEGAFRGCSDISSIEVASGNPVYDSRMNCNALIHTSTNTLMKGSDNSFIPYGVESIASYAFCNSDFEMIAIPETVKKIGNSAFEGCSSLKSISIPGSVTEIGKYAFSVCNNLTSVILGDGVTKIDNNAFNSCSELKSVTFPKSLRSIGLWAFAGCEQLRSIYLPGEMDIIDKYAFQKSGLYALYAPQGVKEIGINVFPKDAFYTLLLGQSLTTNYTSMVFEDSFPELQILVPAGMLEQYKSTAGWSNCVDKFVAYGGDIEYVKLDEARLAGGGSDEYGGYYCMIECATEGYKLAFDIYSKDGQTIIAAILI